MALDIFILLALVGLNGFFALSEMAVVSSRSARLQSLAEGDRRAAGAKVAAQLREKPERFLSTVQIGITMIGVLSGAFGAATVSEPLGEMLSQVEWIGSYGEPAALGIVVVAVTILTLVIGELVPKRIALGNPEYIASGIARPMLGLSRVFGPLVDFLSILSDLALRVLGISAEPVSQVTEEEIRQLVVEGAEAGAIEDVERDIVHRVFRLGDKMAYDIMTPRRQLPWLDIDAPLEENAAVIREAQSMRYAVGQGPRREPVGVIRAEDLLAGLSSQVDIDLFASMSAPLYVPESAKALQVLGTMQSESKFMALVVDEFGEVQGAITMAEIFRAMVGDVTSDGSAPVMNIISRKDGSFLVEGFASVDELKEVLGLQSLPGEETEEFNTIAGAMLHFFGRLPTEGDEFVWDGYRFEVVDLDGTRIDKVLLAPLRNIPIAGLRSVAS
ncbi:MAG: hemolysin family protein [Candidatus Phaeomarinobacter sp.]